MKVEIVTKNQVKEMLKDYLDVHLKKLYYSLEQMRNKQFQLEEEIKVLNRK